MSSLHRDVQLVDLNGRPITPDDQGDAATWPAWTDNWRWELSDPDELAALEAAEIERQCDLRDAPEFSAADRQDFADWLSQADDDAPVRRQVSPIELSMLAAHGAI
jgi:hypothetical protein